MGKLTFKTAAGLLALPFILTGCPGIDRIFSNLRASEGDDAGECFDGADNDGDGLFDCDDDGCFGSPDCPDTSSDGSSDTGTDGGDTGETMDSGSSDDGGSDSGSGDDGGEDSGSSDTGTDGGDTGETETTACSVIEDPRSDYLYFVPVSDFDSLMIMIDEGPGWDSATADAESYVGIEVGGDELPSTVNAKGTSDGSDYWAFAYDGDDGCYSQMAGAYCYGGVEVSYTGSHWSYDDDDGTTINGCNGVDSL